MGFQTCPTDLIEAPAERIWKLIVDPQQLGSWIDAKVADAPRRPLEVGDRVGLLAGPGHFLKVGIEVISLRELEELALEISLPFGLKNHEKVRLRALGSRTRVTYN